MPHAFVRCNRLRCNSAISFLYSAVLFFVYWIANFVVPDIISKDFQSDGEDQTPEEVNPMEGGKQRKPNLVNSSKNTKRTAVEKSSKQS